VAFGSFHRQVVSIAFNSLDIVASSKHCAVCDSVSEQSYVNHSAVSRQSHQPKKGPVGISTVSPHNAPVASLKSMLDAKNTQTAVISTDCNSKPLKQCSH